MSDFKQVLYLGARRYSITLGNLLRRAGHPPEKLCEIVDFLSPVLIIERWSAAQLLDHPWLKNVETVMLIRDFSFVLPRCMLLIKIPIIRVFAVLAVAWTMRTHRGTSSTTSGVNIIPT